VEKLEWNGKVQRKNKIRRNTLAKGAYFSINVGDWKTPALFETVFGATRKRVTRLLVDL